MDTIGDIGELGVIDRIMRFLPDRHDIIVGAGDDCAVVRPSDDSDIDWVLTSDAVTEGAHFPPATDPSAIGHKAIARALSDIAAMGAEPMWALIDISAPAQMSVSAMEALYREASATARKYDLAIVGGDTSQSEILSIHVFAIGSVPKGNAILRAGAERGDNLYVTGQLGASILGKHLAFEPHVKEGRWLREGNWASAMIDLSDGLATDLRHLIKASKVGAEIFLDQIPVSEAATRLKDERSPLEHALCDGEDFELLFSVPAAKEESFVTEWQKAFTLSCARVGCITDNSEIIECVGSDAVRTKLQNKGFGHFSE